MTKMRKLFYCVVALLMVLVIASCQENKQANIVFERVEGMMADYPDSALAILDSMRKESESYPRSQKMKYELLCAKAQNKAYVDFTTDSVMKEVVDYYDAHGTANEKVEAHYLLGCTYRDMHEAPMALSCYYDAVECADTLSEDCDYGMLMRVYGQMADLFNDQILPDEELNASEQYRYCAHKCGNIYEETKGLLLTIRPYSMKNDISKMTEIFNEAQVICEENGYNRLFSHSYPYFIANYLENENYKTAHELMARYEKDSGWFDANGGIEESHEYYYSSKGQYYLGIGYLDSAEYYFRKLLSVGIAFEGYKGLCSLYARKEIADSVFCFSQLLVNATDDELSKIHSKAMLQVSSLYDYSRSQRIAEQNFRLANKNRNIICVMTIVFIIVAAVSYSIYSRYKSKKKIELEALNMNFLKVSERYEAAKKDLVQMGEDYSGFRKAKAEELSALQQQLTQINSQYNSLKHKDKIDALKNSSAFQAIKNKLDPRQKNNLVSDCEWDELNLLVSQCLPAFYSRITNENQLSKQELQVTILTKLGFSSNDIALLLDKPAQRISNAKATSNLKLFGDNSARTFVVNVETL